MSEANTITNTRQQAESVAEQDLARCAAEILTGGAPACWRTMRSCARSPRFGLRPGNLRLSSKLRIP